MTLACEQFGQDVLALTLSVGKKQIGVKEALDSLEAAAAECCGLERIAELWQVTQISNDVMRIAYPEYCAFFRNDDPRTPGNRLIPLDISAKVMIRLVLVGVVTLDNNAERKEGARELLEVYPSPIPKSDTRYVDERGLWDHTHGSTG